LEVGGQLFDYIFPPIIRVLPSSKATRKGIADLSKKMGDAHIGVNLWIFGIAAVVLKKSIVRAEGATRAIVRWSRAG
jgi:hypothetical protein